MNVKTSMNMLRIVNNGGLSVPVTRTVKQKPRRQRAKKAETSYVSRWVTVHDREAV